MRKGRRQAEIRESESDVCHAVSGMKVTGVSPPNTQIHDIFISQSSGASKCRSICIAGQHCHFRMKLSFAGPV
jgi:hypothetical protein